MALLVETASSLWLPRGRAGDHGLTVPEAHPSMPASTVRSLMLVLRATMAPP